MLNRWNFLKTGFYEGIKHLSLYDPVWEGTYTTHDVLANKDITRNIVLEIMPKEIIGEGADRKRDEGAMFVEGNEGWLALAFVRVDPDTGEVSFQAQILQTKFDGVIEGEKITGTVVERQVNKGTFEVIANRDEKPQRRTTIGSTR